MHFLQIITQTIDPADQRHGDDQRRDAGENRADDEIRTEDGAMPHRLDGHGEHEAHHRVHGHGDGDDDDGHHADQGLKHAVLFRSSRPAQGEESIEPVPLIGMIAQNGNVGDQRQVQIECAHRQIHCDAAHVPQQGRLKPSVCDHVQHAVGASQIDEDVAHAEHNDHDRDDLSGSGDGSAPLGADDPQDRRNQRPGVTDPDEEDEVGDVEAPVDGSPESGDAQALTILRDVRIGAERHDAQKDRYRDIEARPRPQHGFQQDRVFRKGRGIGPFRDSGHLTHPPADRSLSVPCRDLRGACTPAGCGRAWRPHCED